MRRQEIADGQLSVWASTEMRPDPFSLPTEYGVEIFGRGEGGPGCETIIVSREEVSFSAGNVGIRVPMVQFLGVAMTVAVSEDKPESDPKASMIIVLEHEDPALNVPLFVSWDSQDVVATWHAWARTLDVPLRVRGLDAGCNQINNQITDRGMVQGTARRPHNSNGASRRLTRTLRRSSSPLGASEYANRFEKRELIARQ